LFSRFTSSLSCFNNSTTTADMDIFARIRKGCLNHVCFEDSHPSRQTSTVRQKYLVHDRFCLPSEKAVSPCPFCWFTFNLLCFNNSTTIVFMTICAWRPHQGLKFLIYVGEIHIHLVAFLQHSDHNVSIAILACQCTGYVTQELLMIHIQFVRVGAIR
jgi:hypothetical protein